MSRKIGAACFVIVSIIAFSFGKVLAYDRVVLKSIPSKVWYQNIYLIADKLTWMDYKNFTVQIGDTGGLVYNFPDWYHGKYETALFSRDINGDKLEDIIVVLNNDKAAFDKSMKDIHILNQLHDPFRRYEEVEVEPIEAIIKNHIKMYEYGTKVTIYADRNKYNIDISKYNYSNPHMPHIDLDYVEYSVVNGKLRGRLPVLIIQDNWVSGSPIGKLNIEYFWNGKRYDVKSLFFSE